MWPSWNFLLPKMMGKRMHSNAGEAFSSPGCTWHIHATPVVRNQCWVVGGVSRKTPYFHDRGRQQNLFFSSDKGLCIPIILKAYSRTEPLGPILARRFTVLWCLYDEKFPLPLTLDTSHNFGYWCEKRIIKELLTASRARGMLCKLSIPPRSQWQSRCLQSSWMRWWGPLFAQLCSTCILSEWICSLLIFFHTAFKANLFIFSFIFICL